LRSASKLTLAVKRQNNDMTSPDTALQAYSVLRTANKLTLAVKRQNNEMTIEYNIE
jgi:type II secretory pathway component PulC